MRRHAAVLLLALLVAFAGLVTAQEPARVPTAGTPDALASVQRTWASEVAGGVADLQGSPVDEDDHQVAFRLDTDVAFAEGVLTVPTERGTQQPLLNVGARFHALSFDPPLPLDGGRSLARIFPGPLDWRAPVEVNGSDGGIAFTSYAPVPLPAEGDSSPEGGADRMNETGLWLSMWFETAAGNRSDPEVMTRSGSVARWWLGVWYDERLVSPRGELATWRDEVHVTATLHFDFGTVAFGASHHGAEDLRATGVYIHRGEVYGTLRALHVARLGPGLTATEHNLSVDFEAPSGRRAPTTTERSLSSPVTLNVTVASGLGRTVNATSYDGGPRLQGEGAGIWMVHELGFLATEDLTRKPAPQDDHDGSDGEDSPGVSTLVALACLTLGFASSRRRATRSTRFLRSASRRPRS